MGKKSKFDDIKNDIYANLPIKSLKPVDEIEKGWITANWEILGDGDKDLLEDAKEALREDDVELDEEWLEEDFPEEDEGLVEDDGRERDGERRNKEYV